MICVCCDLDLCPVCGASWRCEHRPDDRIVEDVPDPHGPPVARIVPIRSDVRPVPNTIPPGRELQDQIEEIVRRESGAGRGVWRAQVLDMLGWQRSVRVRENASPVLRAFNAAVLALKRRRAIIELPSDGLHAYSVQLHAAGLHRELELCDLEIGWLDENLGTKRQARAKIVAELESLRGPDAPALLREARAVRRRVT